MAEPRRLVFSYRRESDAVGRILGAVHAAGPRGVDLTTEQPSPEDVFLVLVGSKDGGRGNGP